MRRHLRRYLAAMIAVSICSMQAEAQAFHVHRVPDHGVRHTHAHGPAIHHHDHAPSRGLRFTDGSESTESLTLSVPPAAQLDPMLLNGVVPEFAWFEPACLLVGLIPIVEARSHGPPSIWRPSFRGPPSLSQSA